MKEQPQAIFWFRRDLRLDDNVGFSKALRSGKKVLPIFIFDEEIINSLPKDDARITFIYETLQSMRKELQDNNSSLAIYLGKPKNIFENLIEEYDIKEVYANHDYEPYAKERDKTIQKLLRKKEIAFNTYKDQVFFEKDEIVKNDGDPYVVYTAYMRRWKEHFKEELLSAHQTTRYFDALYKNTRLPNVSLSDIGFEKSSVEVKPYHVTPSMIQSYEEVRDIPSKDATSYLSPHLRFGTVSIRKMVKKAIAEKNETFWSELIWREFFMQILYHFPHTVTKSFRPDYDNIKWRNNQSEFEKWKAGKTGYPIVDAGMRQLNQTGYMHNRVRMIVGSFLCKHLLIDWRWGEAYFAEKLLDYEMSSNVGNWQWVAGSGVDAAPYFRIFNPITQLDKFDKDRKYVKHWVKEFGTNEYPEYMVDHKEARERCLKTYKEALN
ncbi:deoxyribodipyrimidine photo-lyase [Pustulibacterium marinum]|uniref:Deoxyribodipyrimidine photo-lyase n=1 Tax=Pustulibacterium marinum TaxID=1224947 RepID=A0A1I7HZX5_9FLAO|nr:deoxyribodipyrimidine photo-lyase [Pustulibacterium marinum]SFU66248.1 deoxyribodipyrimidine photo-lyase [Pustulibacterium marinum]